jgi:hypothetical protein
MSPPIYGIDFTSAPRPAKPITIAAGRLIDGAFQLDDVNEVADFVAFERWLLRPGPWIGGFDFPFGLPREAVLDLSWPTRWSELTRHCFALGRDEFRRALDRYRAARPVGGKFPYRRGDATAGAHSPIKLVNPPVALMFLEGASRLMAAGVSVPHLFTGDTLRVALEAYPGYAVRQLFASRARVSYKNDARAKQTETQRSVRDEIVRRIVNSDSLFGFRLAASTELLDAMRADGRGDTLDAVLCALQAAWGWQRCDAGYGLPATVDPVEGWIVTVPGT